MLSVLYASGSNSIVNFITSDELNSTITSRIVVNSLSIFGSLFNIITILRVRTTTVILRKMIVSLCCMDLIFNIISMLSFLSTESPLLCSSLGFLVFYGYNGSIVWTCFFAHCLKTTMKSDETDNTDKLWKIYACLGFVLPLVGAAAGTATHYYIVQEGYCWHYPSSATTIDWQDFFLTIVPTTIAVLYCVYNYLLVICKLRQMGMRVYVELLFYPLILIVCSFPWNTYTLYNLFSKNPPPFKLFVVGNVMLSMQGFLNALAYGLSRTIVTEYKRAFCMKKKIDQSSMRQETKLILAPSEIRSSLLDEMSFSKSIK